MAISVVALWGISGSGKTTVGRALASRLEWDFVDIDDYFWVRRGAPEKMPRITLSGSITLNQETKIALTRYIVAVPPGEIRLAPTSAQNWDSEDAIDWNGFSEDMKKRTRNVVLVGFCLPLNRMPPSLIAMIELRISDNEDILLREVFSARLESKNFGGSGWAKDLFMVKDVVIPFHRDQGWKMRNPPVVYVFNKEKRVPIGELVARVLAVAKL